MVDVFKCSLNTYLNDNDQVSTCSKEPAPFLRNTPFFSPFPSSPQAITLSTNWTFPDQLLVNQPLVLPHYLLGSTQSAQWNVASVRETAGFLTCERLKIRSGLPGKTGVIQKALTWKAAVITGSIFHLWRVSVVKFGFEFFSICFSRKPLECASPSVV